MTDLTPFNTIYGVDDAPIKRADTQDVLNTLKLRGFDDGNTSNWEEFRERGGETWLNHDDEFHIAVGDQTWAFVPFDTRNWIICESDTCQVSRKIDSYRIKDAPTIDYDGAKVLMDDMAEFEGGGRRSSDEGKPRFEYILAPDMPYDQQIIARIANRMAEGAKTYGENNYGLMNTEDALARARSSLLRHTLQYINGDRDEDHMAAIGCNILMISKIEYNLAKKAEKDKDA